MGDLGNIDADKDGKAIIDKKDTLIRLSPGPHCIIGRAIIVHAKADDFSQPVGNAVLASPAASSASPSDP